MHTLMLACLLTLGASAQATPETAFTSPLNGALEELRSLRKGEAHDLEVLPERLSPPMAGFLSDEDRLLDLLQDPDTEVRRLAVKGLKFHIQSTRVQAKLKDIVSGRAQEEPAVRREAVKSLSWASGSYDVKDLLKDLGRRSEETSFGALALKALHLFTSYYDVREVLLERAKDPSDRELRFAAVWALYAFSNLEWRVRDSLLDMLASDADTEIRLEALKSLYLAMSERRVSARMLDTARDSREPLELRRAAIWALSAVSGDYQVKNYLEEAARRDPELVLRTAALEALTDPASSRIRDFFHIGYRTWPDYRYHDPLENE